MSDIVSVHNAFATVMDMYGRLLASQQREIEQLRKQNEELTRIVASYAKAKKEDAGAEKDSNGVASSIGSGQAFVEAGSQSGRGRGTPQGS